MKKRILEIGQALDKAQQQQINGGVNCFECHSYCLANNPFDRQAYGVCVSNCIAQYC